MDRIIEQYFDFGVMFDPRNFDLVIDGFWFTLKLSIVAGILSLIWGLVLAVLRQTPGKWGRVIRWPTIAYIDVLRGVPALLTILLVSASLGALGAVDPASGEGGVIPRWLANPEWLGQPAPFWYGVIAITLTYGAYMAEVYRAGIEAVPHGQMEAARSLGMSHRQAMRRVIVPQAVRKVIPPLLNDFIALMKDTTLVSVIGLGEVVQRARDIQSETLNSSPLVLAALLFVLVTIPLARLVDYLIARQQAKTGRSGGGDDGGDMGIQAQMTGVHG
jgi:polar amino acid transport system permease protein